MVTKKIAHNKLSNRSGLTMIELLVVLAILVILIILAFMAWRGQINKANDAKRKADLERLKVTFEDYYNDKECYPDAAILDNCFRSFLLSIGAAILILTPFCFAFVRYPDKISFFLFIPSGLVTIVIVFLAFLIIVAN